MGTVNLIELEKLYLELDAILNNDKLTNEQKWSSVFLSGMMSRIEKHGNMILEIRESSDLGELKQVYESVKLKLNYLKEVQKNVSKG